MPHPLVVSESVVADAPAELGGFSCTLSGSNSAWIRVVGELDLAASPRLHDALREAESHAHQVLLDLREVTFLDTTGVHVIVDASHRARRSGGWLVLVRGPSHVDRLFRLTGTDAALDIVDLEPCQPPVQALVRRRVSRPAAGQAAVR